MHFTQDRNRNFCLNSTQKVFFYRGKGFSKYAYKLFPKAQTLTMKGCYRVVDAEKRLFSLGIKNVRVSGGTKC